MICKFLACNVVWRLSRSLSNKFYQLNVTVTSKPRLALPQQRPMRYRSRQLASLGSQDKTMLACLRGRG